MTAVNVCRCEWPLIETETEIHGVARFRWCIKCGKPRAGDTRQTPAPWIANARLGKRDPLPIEPFRSWLEEEIRKDGNAETTRRRLQLGRGQFNRIRKTQRTIDSATVDKILIRAGGTTTLADLYGDEWDERCAA